METTEHNVTLRRLTASAGCVLTRRPLAEDPYFSRTVHLGVNDTPDNYMEIPEAEARAITERVRAEREAAQAAAEDPAERLVPQE